MGFQLLYLSSWIDSFTEWFFCTDCLDYKLFSVFLGRSFLIDKWINHREQNEKEVKGKMNNV